MARTSGSTDLYNLIHAMTTAEKGYFKKFAKRHTSSGNKYLDLFNAISKQQVFEEKTLKQKFGEYTAMKKYLFEMIMDSMMVFHKGEGTQHEILMLIPQIDFLLGKGLTDKAKQLTQRAIKTTVDMELMNLEGILRWRLYRMSVYDWKIDEQVERDKEHFAAQKLLLEKQRESTQASEMLQFILHYCKLRSLKAESPTSFPKSYDTTFLFSPTPLLTATAERTRFAALTSYSWLMNDFEAQYNVALRSLQYEKTLRKNKNPIANDATYEHAAHMMIDGCLHTNRYDEVLKICAERLKVKNPSAAAAVKNQFVYFSFQLFAYWGSGRHKEGEAFIAKNLPAQLIKDRGDEYLVWVTEIYRIKLLLEHSNKNYNEVFKSIALIQSAHLKKGAPGYYRSSEILKILLQIELKQYDLLPQMITNALNHLPNYGLTEREKEVLLLLKKIKADNKDEVLQNLRDKMDKRTEDVMLFNSIGIKLWVEMMLDNKPMSALIAREHANWKK